jgi:acetyl-CoA acyltransferase
VKLDRTVLDEFSARSHAQRAAQTAATGEFANEIIPDQGDRRDGSVTEHVTDQDRPCGHDHGGAGHP